MRWQGYISYFSLSKSLMLKPLIKIALVLILVSGFNPVAADEVRVLALFTGKAMLQVGDKKKIVNAGETFEGVLLKSASGRGAVVVIDGESMKLDLISRTVAGGFKKPTRDRATVYPDDVGMYYINGKINGRTSRFLIDTGATYVTISGNFALQMGLDYRATGKVELVETASGRVPAYRIRLENIAAGGIGLRNITAIVIEGNHPNVALLGNSFLSRTQMTRAGSALEIRKRY